MAKLYYFVFCSEDREPTQIVVNSFREFLEQVAKLVEKRGPVEWIQRIYK